MTTKFVRRDAHRFAKLGKNRPTKQTWRKPTGRDNKIRLNRQGYPKAPTVGHKSPNKETGKIQGKEQILVRNLKDLKQAGKNSILIISGRLGAKKKMEVIKEAQEKKLQILNVGGKK